MTDAEIIAEAKRYAHQNSTRIIAAVIGDACCKSVPAEETPFTVFMAGSPGAGKTEWSKFLIASFPSNIYGVARIDADDFRAMLPNYDGKNSHLFQDATSALLTNAFHSVMKHRKNCILDTTFSKKGQAFQNVGEALNNKRTVEIVYVYQEPTSAWGFVQKREIDEGRRIPKDAFIEKFMSARLVVDEIKSKFTDRVLLTVVVKDILSGKEPTVATNAKSVASVIKKVYNYDELVSLIK